MYRIYVALTAILFWSGSAWPKNAPQTEIHVTLLGQPCLLQGPFDEPTLKTIHTIGPAQVYPNLSTADLSNSKEQARKALEKIRGLNSLPSLLDRYREKLGKRLDAQLAFLDGLDSIKKTHKSLPLLKIGKKYLQSRDIRPFENLVKKIDSSGKGSPPYRDLIEQIFDFYNDAIEPDPEEEFHRAIKRMNVQYMCSFEESEDGIGE